jgi:hypothetical protein
MLHQRKRKKGLESTGHFEIVSMPTGLGFCGGA